MSRGAEILNLPDREPLPGSIASAAARVLADVQGVDPLPISLGYGRDTRVPTLGTVIVALGEEQYGFQVDCAASEAEQVYIVAEGVQADLSETGLAWGQARPACPGHPHPAIPRIDGSDAVWVCPRDGRRLALVGSLHVRLQGARDD